MFRLAFPLLLAATTVAAPSVAQTLSVDEIRALVTERVSEKDEYRALLQDEDPERSLAAMQIMLGSGDNDLQRMALEQGLFSPNPVVQRTALQSFFASGAVLNVMLEPGEAKDNNYFQRNIASWSGSIDAEGRGHLSLLTGEWDEASSCWLYRTSNGCFVRLSDANVMLNLWNSWWSVKLNESGELTGSGSMPNVATAVTAVAPVAN